MKSQIIFVSVRDLRDFVVTAWFICVTPGKATIERGEIPQERRRLWHSAS
jgi:hypothetical protein